MYKGQQAILPAGRGGFNGDENANNIPITDLRIARNICYVSNAWEKMPGLAQYDTNGITASPTILEGIQYQPSPGTSRVVLACDNGSVYREATGNIDASTYVTGLTFTEAVVLLSAGEESFSDVRKLFMFSKGVAPRVVTDDGTTLDLLTDIPIDWAAPNFPSGAVYHDSRVVAFMKHELYFSNLADHDDFLTNDPPIISVAPGFSDKIVCGFSYLPEQLYVWKYPFGIYAVDTTDITGLIIPVRTVKQDIGGSGPRGVCRVKNDVWFVSSTGHIHSLTAVENSEDTKESDITAMLNLEGWVKDNVDLTKLHSVDMVYHEERQEVSIAFASKESVDGNNDLRVVLDVSQPDLIRASIDDRGEFFNTLFMYKESDSSFQLFTGGDAGKLFRANRASRSIDLVTPYVAMFEYPETDLGYMDPGIAHMAKRFDWLEITGVPTGNYSISFDIYIDGNHTETVTANLGQVGGTLGSFILDTDRLGGGTLVNHKVKIHGRGRRIAVRGTNTGTNENFIITQIMLHYKTAFIKGTS